MWGGPTPPAFSMTGSSLTTADCTRVTGMSPATPGYVLAVIGIAGVFFSPLLAAPLRGRLRSLVGVAVLGGFAAFVVAIVPTSVAQFPEHISGLWGIQDKFQQTGLWSWMNTHVPVLAQRSPFIVLPAALGGVMIVLWGAALGIRERWILGASLAGFTASQTAGALTWQRYIEPMVLITFALAACRLPAREMLSDARDVAAPTRPPTHEHRGLALAGPLALACLLAVYTAVKLS